MAANPSLPSFKFTISPSGSSIYGKRPYWATFLFVGFRDA
jgi:hypothetical protein